MTILKSLTIKNLKLNKKRTIVTIIGIMLATALIVALSSLVFSFRASMIEFEKYSSGNYHYKFLDVPEDEIKYIKSNRDVEDTYITQDIGYAVLEDSKSSYKPYLFLQAFSQGALNNLTVHILEGRMPENENEIIISNHIKTEARVKYNVGDTLTLDIGKRISDGYELNQFNPITEEAEEQLEKQFTRTYTIVGIIERPNSSIEVYNAPGYTIITTLDEDNLNGVANVYARYTKKGIKNQYETTANILETNEKNVKDFMTGVALDSDSELKYDVQSNKYLINYETLSFSDGTMASLYSIAGIITVIIMVTSIFCIKNSFAISITEKVKQYGMLASVGTTSKQIKKNVYFESIILAIIGIPLGIALGLLASFILIHVCNVLLAESLNMKLIYKISALAIAVSFVLSLVTCLLSARSSAKKASKIAPIDAIRGNQDIKIKSKKVKSPKIVKKIFGEGGDIAYKNLKRNRRKYRTTVISIVVCVSVFIATSSFVDLAFRTIKIAVGEYDYNIDVYIAGENAYEKAKEITEFDNADRCVIQRVSFINTDDLEYNKKYKQYSELYNFNIDNDSVKGAFVYSLGDEEYNRYIKELGLNYQECKDKAILVNKAILQVEDEKGNSKKIETSVYDNKKGDIIRGAEIQLEIEAVTEKTTMGMNRFNYIDAYFIVSDEFMDKYYESNFVNMYFDSSNPDELQDEIETFLKDENLNIHINNIEQSVKMMKSMYLLIAIFLYGFITVIALIGVTNIFNTITTSMELRAKEFAMLKSVGMTKKEFNKMIRLESLFYGMKSLIIGIPIGIGISYLLFNVLMQELEFAYQLPLNGILISLIAVFLLIWSIMKFSLNKINKQNIIETIRRDNI